MFRKLVVLGCAVALAACSETQDMAAKAPLGKMGDANRRMVRASMTGRPDWVDMIGEYQKKNTDKVYAVGGVQNVRDREDGKRDAEMIAKRALAENLGQRMISKYLYGRSTERTVDLDETAKVIQEAMGASADQVVTGAMPVAYYWEEWSVDRTQGPTILYEVQTLVALDPARAKQAAADLASRATEKLRKKHNERATQLLEEMRKALDSDPNAAQACMGLE